MPSEEENIPRFPAAGQPQTHAQWKTGISADQVRLPKQRDITLSHQSSSEVRH